MSINGTSGVDLSFFLCQASQLGFGVRFGKWPLTHGVPVYRFRCSHRPCSASLFQPHGFQSLVGFRKRGGENSDMSSYTSDFILADWGYKEARQLRLTTDHDALNRCCCSLKHLYPPSYVYRDPSYVYRGPSSVVHQTSQS